MTTGAETRSAELKSADAFRTISEVAEDLDLPQHVLRFWETRFPQIKPLKRAGGRRFYRPADIRLLLAIRQLLYGEGYTIKGVQRLLKEQGARGVQHGLRPAFDEAGSGSAPTVTAPLRATILMPEERDLLRGALEAVAECQRILEAVLA